MGRRVGGRRWNKQDLIHFQADRRRARWRHKDTQDTQGMQDTKNIKLAGPPASLFISRVNHIVSVSYFESTLTKGKVRHYRDTAAGCHKAVALG